jgi:hypothetical protein
MSRAVTKLSQSGQAFDPVKDGRVIWVADEVIGFKCGCGNDEVLLLSPYEDTLAECDVCCARLYYKQKIEVMQVKD